ncbi:MAG TPA: nucleoside hydrolase, partial [Bacteroidota bacterium]
PRVRSPVFEIRCDPNGNVKTRSANIPLLIDTDAGVDDALAILYAVHSPGIRVEAITTVAGNVEVEKCTRNVNVILDHATLEYRPPVVQGAAKPLRLPLVTAPEVHGNDGLGNTQQQLREIPRRRSGDAVDCIRECCDRFHGELTIVALGPLTNIALALKKYPRSLRKVKRIVSMGGAFRVPGNTGPVAEFNYFVDPHAANIVLNANLPVIVVPLDLTEQIVFTRDELRTMCRRRRSKLSSFILRFSGYYMRYHKTTLGFEGGYLHDPLAMAIAILPSLAEYRRAHVSVESAGMLARGMTVADLQTTASGKPRIAVAIDREKFLESFHRRVFAH